MNKICLICKIEKSETEYQLRSDTGNRRNQCIKCRQEYINGYRRTNDEYKQRYNLYRKHRRDTDINYLLKERLRARIRKVLNSKNIKKCMKSEELLGCSIEFFKEHIEKQFQKDMSWNERNFVLDHILPCSSFDLSDLSQLKKCFHYTNIQPLTWEENSKKGDKILLDFK